MSQSRRPSMTADAIDPPTIDGISDSRRSGVRLHNAHQSVVAQTLNNAQGLNFTSHGSSTGSDGFNQSIRAESIGIQGGVKNVTKNYYNGSESGAIRDWLSSLSPLRFEDKQNENIKTARNAPGTGRWLLESPMFIDWRHGETRRLWCYGIPGAGKTILASIVIKYLQDVSRLEPSNEACIYAYFDYKEQESQDLTNLLSSLLAQLIRHRQQVTEDIKELYQGYTDRKMYPSPEEYLRVLKSQVKFFSKVFVVVDALDECLNDPKTNTLDEFLRALRQLPKNVHIMFTSRHDMSIRDRIQPDGELVIHASDSDLRRYLENRINSREQLKTLVDKEVQKDKNFLDNALKAIVARSKGMFLLAQLHLDSLRSSITIEDFNSGINGLPLYPDEVYRKALDRIFLQDETRRNLAISILTWLVLAERPLTTAELKEAISVRVGDKTLREGRLVTDNDLTSACAGIVVVNQGVIRLAHYTAEKYLKDNESTIFKDAQSSMAETCLVYLLFDEFAPISQDLVADRLKHRPFLLYAADHWGDHASLKTKGNVNRLAFEFLSNPSKVMNAFQVMSNPQFRKEVNVTGLHVAAYFGMDKLAKKLLAKGFLINAATQRGETALHWAAFNNQQRFMKVLIDNGANLNLKDADGRTALHTAVINEDVLAVQLLLSSRYRAIDLDVEDSQRWTALRWAAAYRQVAIVEMLLKANATIDAQDEDGWTALRWAAQRGHRNIVELLIRRGANVEMPSSDEWTLLRFAAREGRDTFIRLLIEKRVNLNAVDSEGWSALRWAVDYGHGMVVWLLIQAHADINKADHKGLTPLHSAVEKWHESRDKSLIWLLLENKAHVNAQTKLGLTPLHIAAARGYISVIWLLLEKKADVSAQTKLGETPLHIAASQGNSAVVQLILENKADIKAQTKLGLTPFHTAAAGGHASVLWILLQNKADIDHQTKHGLTALHMAATKGHTSVVMFLLKNGANPIRLDNNERTALHCAVIEEQHETSSLLLQNVEGLVHATDDEKRTALHLAASSGNLSIVKFLLGAGAQIDAQDRHGYTPLHCAVSQQQGDVVTYLVDVDADLDIPSKKKGWVALHTAASAGNMEIVSTLLEKADPTIENSDGLTPWELARENGYEVGKF